MKVTEIVNNGFNNISLTVTNKASSVAISMPRFLNIHKLRCHMIHNYYYYTILVFVKSLKVLVNNRKITLFMPKLR